MHLKFWLGATFLTSGLLAAADTPQPNVHIVEEIVAKVNNDIITRGELEKVRAQIEAEIRVQKRLEGAALESEVRQKHADALRDQIDQLLLVEKGKELNINVDPDLNRRLAEIQVSSKESDPDKFHKWVEEQSGGMPFEDVKQQMKNQMLTQRVIGQEVGRNINIPQADIQKYYDEHKAEFIREEMVFLSEILIVPTDKNPAGWAAAEKKAKDVSNRARNGEKFPQLVKDYSGAETAKNEGELGSFKRGMLIKPIEDVVFKQNKGYISDPIKTDNGFEILKVDERYAAGQASLTDVEDQIKEKLYMPKMQPALRTYLTKLRQDAFLEIRGGYVDSGAAPGKDTSWKEVATLKPETTTKEEVASRKKKKVMGVIPHSGKSVKSDELAPPPLPTETPKATPAASPATPPSGGDAKQ